ncbi:MAG: glycosyl transferase [Acidobacteria bacterium]|nr:MAG: glycosyl transferase [Acidobacteriota bacterium]
MDASVTRIAGGSNIQTHIVTNGQKNNAAPISCAPAQAPVCAPAIVLDLPVNPKPASSGERATIRGKFLWKGRDKLYLRGVTYGTFRPGPDGCSFPSPPMVERDFSQMSANGLNALRTYTAPPRWLLDIAEQCNLRVLVGLQGERHYGFLGERKIVREIRKQVRSGARACTGHPAVLGYVVANEIPASIVRWHGARTVERFLKLLSDEVREEDPEGLVSYANYPSTEYLDLSFLDLVCFNVFLESPERYEAYLVRLQNLAGNRPLLVTEIGLDSQRNGEKGQAACLNWQIRKAFAAGCAGAFVYAWTDEWYRAGEDVADWDFGLTSRGRLPKQALGVVRRAFEEVPFPSAVAWPKISIVVCTFNGSRTIRDCLEGIAKLRYPNFEAIVIDDGSTDGAGDIAAEYEVRVIRTENQGLSAARNLGWQSATGEIVAYIDDDALPDPDWLTYLAAAFLNANYAGVGGPNIPIPDDGETASCVAAAPGGPAHVLISDCEAEHIPGCNMAFRRNWLLWLSRGRIYQGTWGTAGYARLDQPAPNLLNSLPLMHEWQLMNLVLAVLGVLGMVWRPLLSALPVAVATFGLSLVSPISAARNIRFPRSAKSGFARFRLRVLTVMLHLMQPWARLWSRLIYSLTVGRIRRFPTISLPWPRTFLLWSEKWIDTTTILHSLESLLRSSGAVVRRGGDYDRWDLEIRGGLFGGIRIRTVSETYGRGKHSLRLHFRPWFSISGAGTTLLLTTACFVALLDRSVYAAAILGILSAMFGAMTFRSGAVAVGAIHRTLIKLDFERI